MSIDEIKAQLDFALSLKKPEQRRIDNLSTSDQIIKEIANVYYRAIPAKRTFGLLTKRWDRATFECSPGVINSISVRYKDGSQASFMPGRSVGPNILSLLEQPHELEKDSYNWDHLEFEILPDGSYTVERGDYIWEEHISLTSFPEKAIKAKYFHFKWIPVFHDFSGNYIGIDLDPDELGTKGQVIIYGRDEENMVVLANDLDQFLDWIYKEAQNNQESFLSEVHLHEVLRNVVLGSSV